MKTRTRDSIVSAFFHTGEVRRAPLGSDTSFEEASLLSVVAENGTNPLADVGARFTLTVLPFGAGALHIATRGFLIHPEPKTSLSAVSGALYLGRSLKKSHGWLLQVLPPNQVTSRHFHKVKTERFINLQGKCFMAVHESTEIDITGRDYTIYRNTPHYTYTEEEWALNLLIISGLPDPLTMEDHHYLPLPQ